MIVYYHLYTCSTDWNSIHCIIYTLIGYFPIHLIATMRCEHIENNTNPYRHQADLHFIDAPLQFSILAGMCHVHTHCHFQIHSRTGDLGIGFRLETGSHLDSSTPASHMTGWYC